jgi:hypothetical protein
MNLLKDIRCSITRFSRTADSDINPHRENARTCAAMPLKPFSMGVSKIVGRFAEIFGNFSKPSANFSRCGSIPHYPHAKPFTEQHVRDEEFAFLIDG